MCLSTKEQDFRKHSSHGISIVLWLRVQQQDDVTAHREAGPAGCCDEDSGQLEDEEEGVLEF